MNSNDNLMPTNISQIITNFSNLVRNFTIKDTEWQIQKEEYEKRISELEGEIKAHENINIDLLKRIRMLEFALAQERKKNNPNESDNNNINTNEDLIKDLPQQNLIKEEDLQFLRDHSNRPSLLNVLQSIGIDENLAKNLFTDFELNRSELEAMIKKNLDEQISKINKENNFDDSKTQNSNIINNEINTNSNLNLNNNIINNNIINNNNSSPLISNQNNSNNNNYVFSLNKCIELKSHFDEVRKLCYINELNSLISVSEDCLIKVWSLNNIFSLSQNEDIEPYLTLRGHTGPLYCVEHGKKNLLYTGGNEGLIQIWNISNQEEIQLYGESDIIFNMNVAFFQKNQNENEIIWDLKHHPKDNLLISLSSDSTINFWETTSSEEFMNSFSNENYENYNKWLKNSKSKKSNYLEENAIPTNCQFLKNDDNKLIIGFNDATVSLMDINKYNFINNYNCLSGNNSYQKANKVLYQPNCFVCSNIIPLVYSGFEDGSIKTFDLRNNNNNVITNNLNAHSDAVMSLNLFKDIYLFSISHDTTIKMWDIRNMREAVVTSIGSQKKWDEAMFDSLLIENQLTLCVACADCTIKLYKL